jgi:hypothetical protein
MKLSKTTWMVLGIGVIIIAAVSLYMVYQGQVQKRQEARDSLANVEQNLQSFTNIKEATEVELIQLEDELQEWQNELSQLETELAQAKLTLDQTGARFPSSVESIEYDEVLFSFAHDANLKITSLTAGEPAETITEDITVPAELTTEDITVPMDITIEGITYATTFFTVEVKGEVADILDFVNRVVTDEGFKTAVLEPVSIEVPEPLSDAEKESIKEEVAAAEIDRLIAEAIQGLPEQERLTQEDIDKIVMELGALIQELKGLTAAEIAELTALEIEDLIKQATEGLAEEITEEDVVELIAKLEEAIEELKGLTVEEIAELAAKEIEEKEMPSATISMMLYSYQGEGE